MKYLKEPMMNLNKKLFSAELILDSLKQNIFVKDLNSIYLYANATYADLVCETPSTIVGKSDYDFFPKHIAEKYRKDDTTLFNNREAIDVVEDIFVGEQKRIIRTVKTPLYSNGEVFALLGVFWDITKEKEEELKYKKLQDGLNKAQELANIGHWELDLVTNKLFWSDEVYRIFGLKPQEFGATYDAFLKHIHPDDIPLVDNTYMNSLEAKCEYHVEHRIVRENGEIGFVEERCEHEFGSDGKPIKSIGTVHDITKQKVVQKELSLASAVFEKMNDGALITDEKQRIIKINSAFTKITGYTLEDIKGKTPHALSSGWHDSSFYKNIWEDINKKGEWEGEIIDRKKNGEIYTAELNILALHNDDGILTNYISVNNDISEKKQQQDLIHNLAYYDSLTKLPNRVLFEEHVVSAMPESIRNNKKMALLFIDMDNFKNINDTLGHHVGDKFLIEVSNLIKSHIRKQDTFARLGGDEFTILLQDIDSITDIATVADKIIKQFAAPVEIEGNKLYSGVSMGISVYPDDGKTYEILIKASDTAMYHVKETGKNGYKFYAEAMNLKITERVYLENDLRSAIEKNEFFLVYQPKINLETNSVYGMEALIRWRHPKKGLVGPDKFIQICEDTGLINGVGLWVAKQAISDTKRLHENGHMLTVSINVSSKQLEEESFVDDICAIAYGAGIDKSYVELEITETHIMNNIDKALLVLNSLYDRGFKLSIDDFGTGYSSLSYLKKLPAKTIKIDRSFVLDIDKDEDDRSIVAAIIAMARSLGKDVIAEGSETKEHVDTLKFLNCNNIQGYYFSKPLELDKFIEFISNFKG